MKQIILNLADLTADNIKSLHPDITDERLGKFTAVGSYIGSKQSVTLAFSIKGKNNQITLQLPKYTREDILSLQVSLAEFIDKKNNNSEEVLNILRGLSSDGSLL